MPRKTRHARKFRFEQLENRYLLTTLSVNGDYSQDGLVNAADYTVWRDAYAQVGAGLPADGNGDAVVNQPDLDAWRSTFGNAFGADQSVFLIALPAVGRQQLTIVGTSHNDYALVERVAEHLNVTVSINGEPPATLSFNAATIDEVFFRGYEGDDRLQVSSDLPTTAYGDDGDDLLFGGLNNDMLFGGAGNDNLNGGAGNDELYGDVDNDYLVGGLGNDNLLGDVGDDYLLGEDTEQAPQNVLDVLDAGSGSNVIVAPGMETPENTGEVFAGFSLVDKGTIDFVPHFRGSGWTTQHQADVNTAFGYLEEVLAASFVGENIDVAIEFGNIPGLAGSAGPSFYLAVDGVHYPIALLKHLRKMGSISFLGFQLPDIDIEVTIASGTAPGADFRETIVHEVTHGLGFDGFHEYTHVEYDSDFFGDSYTERTVRRPTPFTTFIESSNGKSFVDNMIELDDGMDGTTDVDLLWTGRFGRVGYNGLFPRLFAPDSYNAGSSISHLDDSVHTVEVMGPSGSSTREKLYGIELGMLADIGWNVAVEIEERTREGRLHRVDPDIEAMDLLDVREDPEWSTPTSMASLNGWVYVIENASLWRVDPDNGAFTRIGDAGDWAGPTLMTAYDDRLYVIQDQTLWRVNPTGGAGYFTKVGNTGDWSLNPTSMTALGNRLYIIENNTLWRVNPAGGSNYFQRVGASGDWAGNILMTSFDDRLYIVQDETLWRVNPSGGSGYFTKVGSTGDWALAPSSITTLGDHLYIVENDTLWRVDPSGIDPPGSADYFRRVGLRFEWPGETLMTAVGNDLYIIRA